VRGDAAERFLHAFELADRGLELAAHARIGAGEAHQRLGAADRGGRQRDRPARGEAAHQHHPALARVVAPADDPVDRHEHVLAGVRAVLEHRVERQMAPADVHAGGVGGHQGAGNAQIAFPAQQLVGIVKAESQTEQRGDRPERDVALVPGDAHAEHFLALPHAFAHHAGIRNRGGIRPGFRAGEREARHLQALRQARQVMLLLLVGAVVQQQLARPERVRHHHRDRRGARARGELLHHRRVAERAEAQAPVPLRDDHAEEAVVLDELPHLRRQILALVRDLPVVAHRAQRFHRTVEESLLLGGKARLRDGEEPVPVGLAGEKVAVPPHRAGVDGFLLGLRHVGQHAAVEGEDAVGDELSAQGGEHGGS
jgi:hypothetical protein